jgi:LacI family transcriptional regulator
MGQCMRVLQDDAACGKMAADYLLSIGFTNFLTFGKRHRTVFRNRIQAFVDRVDIPANTVRSAWIGENVSAASLRKPLEAALKATPKPVAIFSPSDVISAHVMRYVLDLGLQIPGEVAILSCDNEELICDYAPVPLSSIHLNFDMLGYEGAKFLDHLMRKKKVPPAPALIPPVEVVARQSTNTIAVPDARAAQALRFIWTNLHRPLSVNDVAAAAESSPSTLNRLFRQHLGRTLTDEIARARIAQAKTLLTTTKLAAKEIAKLCGFNTPNYFNNVFRGATNMAPRAFRRAFPGQKQGMATGPTSSK